jgi:Xaa-Pro aminopeptidase
MIRGFETSEYKSRVDRAQRMMADDGIDALLLTTEQNVRYFTGYLTRFWESPSRPWFLIVPQSGKPVAVIPSIGAALMGKTWISDIRTWSAPDLVDDGVTLLVDTLAEIMGKTARIGIPSGYETHLRMPLTDFDRVRAALPNVSFGSDANIMHRLRMVKSDAEIGKIETACAIAGRAFDRVGEIAGAGVPLDQVFRDFQRLCLAEGADWVPYLAGGTGPMGYDDVISPATNAPLQDGSVLMLDTGLVWDGYFCDYDRNFAIGAPSKELQSGWSRLLDATEAGKAAATVGNIARDVYHAMDRVLTGGQGGGDAGRLGHGLGMSLTEGLSFIAGDETELQSGMVITLEPGIEMPDGSILVHEDNYVITPSGPRQISPAAPKDLWVI